MDKSLFEQKLAELAVDDLTEYLINTGWTAVATKNKRVLVFREPGESKDPLLVSIPSDTRYGDYVRRMGEALETLSAVSNVLPWKLVDEISNPFRDVLRLRLVKQESLLPFEYAVQVIDQLRDFIFFAASAQKKAHPYIRKPNKEAFDYLRSCKFGHTFPGSFGFTVESYIYESSLPLPGMEPFVQVPFQRQVMERIAIGLVTVAEARKQKDADIIVNNYEHGLVGNMCDALNSMFTAIQSPEIECDISWANKWKSPLSNSRQTVKLDVGVTPYLVLASKKLQTKEHLPEETTIIGQVIELRYKARDDDDGLSDRQVIVWGRDQKTNRFVHVRMQLNAADYRVACAGHPEGRFVKARGVLEKGKKYWHLRLPTEFKILEGFTGFQPIVESDEV